MNVRFWKGTLAAFVAAVVVKAVLQTWWVAPNIASIFPGTIPLSNIGPRFMLGLLAAAVVTFLAVYVLCEFLEKQARAQNKKPFRHGAQFGLAVGLMESLWTLLLPVPASALPLRAGLIILANVLAFAAAAWAYQRLDPGPVVRGEENKRYLAARKKL